MFAAPKLHRRRKITSRRFLRQKGGPEKSLGKLVSRKCLDFIQAALAILNPNGLFSRAALPSRNCDHLIRGTRINHRQGPPLALEHTRSWLPQGKKQRRPCSFCQIDKAMSAKAKRSVRKTARRSRTTPKNRRWSAGVTKRSNALDLEPKIFQSTNPRKIALSLKRSAERSKRRKAKPYQSAMSMLNFYINRAGKNLPKKRQHILERAKDELRDLASRDQS